MTMARDGGSAASTTRGLGGSDGAAPPTARRRGTPVLSVVLALAVLVAVLAAGTIGWYWWQRSGPAPAGVTVETGAVFGDGARTIDLYLDPACPACRGLESDPDGSLRALADSGDYTVRYHVVAFLDDSSPDDYATRAANAAHCAGDAGRFREYLQVLADDTDPRSATSDNELVSAGRSVGITGAAAERFADCVSEGTYEGFVRRSTAHASDQGIRELPTTLVDGEPGGVPTSTADGAQ